MHMNTGKDVKNTILFVEDNPLVLASYRPCLEREGYTVEAATDGEMALEKLPQLKPGLVILDLLLPKLNGAEVLHFIRGHAELKHTPVLILSNAYVDERALKETTPGADKRLLKTQCTPAALIQAVRELLGMAPAANGTPQSGETGAHFFKETRAALQKDAPAEIAKIREHCQAYIRAGGSPAGLEHLNQLYQRVRFLCARSGLGDCTRIAHLASAIEAMLFEIIFKKHTPAPSALQTITQAVDCLGRLFQDGIESAGTALKAKVLVVDDDPVCNIVTVSAMKRARLEAVSTQDPVAALDMAQAERYDMVLLDVNMPGLNGFEVCEKLRLMSGYQKTPVIFVTSGDEFQSRARAVLSGASDFIAKPVAPLELALKTIIHLIGPGRQAPAPGKAQIKAPALAATPSSTVLEQIEANADAIQNERLVEQNEAPAPPLFVPEPAPGQRIQLTPAAPGRGLFLENHGGNDAPLDKLAGPVARILFGEGRPSEMQLRLTRIALEHHNVPEIIGAPGAHRNGNGHAAFDGVVRKVARIIFENANISEMQLRLTRIALKHYGADEIIALSPAANGRSPAHIEQQC